MSSENLTEKISSAMDFARQIHNGHRRASGEYYYEHTIRVYEKLVETGIHDETTLIAAILHQSLDISNALEEEIEKRFGADVLKIVRGYKKLSDTSIESETSTPKNFNEMYIMQTYINMANDIRVLVVRMADKIDNLETSFALSKEKRLSNAQKALHFYSPLARLMGLGKLAIQLENSAFKILEPGEFSRIEKMLARMSPKYWRHMEDLEKTLTSILEERGIEARFQSRIKHTYGIYRKAKYYTSKTKDPGKMYEKIYDIAAMRIIVGKAEDCYEIENIMKELLETLPEERNDFISQPRHTGYKSLHNTYKVARDTFIEVQIRTEEMHELSEFGPASHLLYKIGDKDSSLGATEKFRQYLKEKPYWFKDLNFWEIEKALAAYKPQTPFSKYVYAFTPKGDIIQLPKGANLIDFAYAVHSKLGDRCIGGFINGDMVKLTQEIQDGDRVEIQTLKSKNKPSSDWLKIVKTARAKNAIRKALKI